MGLEGIVSVLRQAQGPLVAIAAGDGALDVRVPPAELTESPATLLCALRTGVRETEATAIGLVLPVRTLWGEDEPCDPLDAEALVLAAASTEGTVAGRCALHELPDGWSDAHVELRWLTEPLRRAFASAATQD